MDYPEAGSLRGNFLKKDLRQRHSPLNNVVNSNVEVCTVRQLSFKDCLELGTAFSQSNSIQQSGGGSNQPFLLFIIPLN